MPRRVSLTDLPPAIVAQLRAKYAKGRPAVLKPPAQSQDWSDHLADQLRERGYAVLRELRFHPRRKWRVDVALPVYQLAVEVEGFGRRGRAGRHQTAEGFAADAEKYAELVIAGWRLIRVTTRQVKNGKALGWVLRAIDPATGGGHGSGGDDETS